MRDLHDQLAHQLGVVSLGTGTAQRWLGRAHDRTTTALASAEQASRTALETMPAILQALRFDDRTAVAFRSRPWPTSTSLSTSYASPV